MLQYDISFFIRTFVSTKVPKTPTQKEGMGGKLPLTNRCFGGFRYAAKITNTAVGLSRLSFGVVRKQVICGSLSFPLAKAPNLWYIIKRN